MKIKKADSKKFVDEVCKQLLELGAKKVKDVISKFRTFELDTIVGKLEINVDTDNVHCYTVFSRFDDVTLAKQKFACSTHTGKYNVHVGAVEGMTPDKAIEIAMIAFEMTQPKK